MLTFASKDFSLGQAYQLNGYGVMGTQFFYTGHLHLPVPDFISFFFFFPQKNPFNPFAKQEFGHSRLLFCVEKAGDTDIGINNCMH